MTKNKEINEAETQNSAEKASKSTSSRDNVRAKSNKPGIADRMHRLKEYFVLSRLELRKVSWPTWKETRTTSIVVLGFVAVMALLLGLVDLFLSGTIRFILS